MLYLLIKAGVSAGIVPRPVIMQGAGVQIVDEHAPARSAGQTHARAAEVSLPTVERPERSRKRVADRAPCPTIAAEPVEIDLVEHDRPGSVQLLALEPAIDHRRQVGIGKRGGKPSLDHVQRLHRAGIIVLVMRADQPLGQTDELCRIEPERLRLVQARERGRDRAGRLGASGGSHGSCSQPKRGDSFAASEVGHGDSGVIG